MFCPHCGCESPDDARFCSICGAPLQKAEPTAQERLSRPLWPWIVLCLALLAAVILLLILLLGRGKSSKQPSPAASPAESALPVITGQSPTPAPQPTTEIIVITPCPSAEPTATAAPTAQPIPDAVRICYGSTPLEEFTEAVGNSLQLRAAAYPEALFPDASFQWSVSDPSVLKLEPDAKGQTCTVTVLKAPGSPVTLTANCEGIQGSVLVYTKAAPAGSAELSGDRLYRINIFLSNFSEQMKSSFNSTNAADDFLLRFVELYCKLNHHDRISYLEGEECLSLEDANLYLQRFFDRSVNPVNNTEYMLSAWNTFTYRDGYFRFPAADGEAYNHFTVAYEMTANADGTYTVQFQNYELDLMEYWDNGISDPIYHMNNDEVANLVFSGRAKPVQGGTAVVRDYTFNGVPTFQILSYEVWSIIY